MLQETLALLDTTLAKPGPKIPGGEFVNEGIESGMDDCVDENLCPVELQLNELREARIRAAQMEKTMRWWSDCTANWRDKWGKVKGERNKARDEIKALKVKLDAANQDICQLKRERYELSLLSEENVKLTKDVEKMEAELRRDRRAFVPPLRVGEGSSGGGGDINLTTAGCSSFVARQTESLKHELEKNTVLKNPEGKLLDGLNGDSDYGDKNPERLSEPALSAGSIALGHEVREKEDEDGPHNGQELNAVKDKLENAQKEILQEKRSKESLVETIDELKAEIDHLKGNIQEETIAKDKAINELNRFKDEQEKRLSKSNSSLGGSYSKENVERRLRELRVEIEKLQKENASEWSKREKLETEKLTAERENKKLRHQLTDLENELCTKMNETSQAASFDFKQIQNELGDKKKELADLRAAHVNLKIVYQDKKEDVLHTKKRVDQHEDEIKKLRARIDELKQKLSLTEDEVDQKENLARKLQRSLDEQTQQCQILRVQMEHLQTRWKKMTSTTRAKRGEKSNSTDDEVFLEIDDD